MAVFRSCLLYPSYAQGRSHKDIAATLGLTPATVRTYLRTAYAALGVSNKLELVVALRHQ